RKTDGQGQTLSEYRMPEGKSYPDPESPIFREAEANLKMRYAELLNSDRRGIIGKVDTDLDAQHIKSQRLYLRESDSMYREPEREPTAVKPPHQMPDAGDWSPVSQVAPETLSVPQATTAQPGPAITPASSVEEMFAVLAQAAMNKDDAAFSAVAQAYTASPDGQAWEQAGREYNQALAEQQEQARQQEETLAQQDVQRGPVIRM
ncbi:MAG: hypothetical protein Q4G70_09675, partial [Pseudomonadota bacterium]|nr:hypothetical protein [Pseudomonadota bacterium]